MKEQELLERLDKLPIKKKPAFLMDIMKAYPSFHIFKIKLAYLYIEKGEILKAKTLLEKELAKRYSIHLQIALANIELQSNNKDSAKESIELLLKNNPNSPHVQILRGRLFKQQGKFKEALEAFKKAHHNHPKIVKPVLELHKLYMRNGQVEKAKFILLSGIKHKPDNYSYHLRLGQVWQELGNTAKALESFKHAKRLANNTDQAGDVAIQLVLLKSTHLTENEVIQQLRNYCIQYPKHIGLRLNLVSFLTSCEQYQIALTEIKLVQEIAPNNFSVLYNKALLFHRQGLNDEAELICDTILEQDPNQLENLLLKANLLYLRENTEEAFRFYNKSVELHPNTPLPYLNMGQFLYQEGDIRGALQILERGLSLSNNIKSIRYKYLRFLIKSGEFQQAISVIAEYRKTTSAFDPRIYFLEMQLFQRQGHFEYAKNLAQHFLEDCSKDTFWETSVLSFLSETAYLAYDYSSAESILVKLVNQADDTNILRNRLSLLYLLKGDLVNAKKQLKIATKEIEEKELTGKVMIPLIGHTSKVLNEIQINPQLKQKAIACFKLSGIQRLNYLAKLNVTHPEYFGFSLYLSNEFISQSILKRINDSLSNSNKKPKIPKTIIQYWDKEIPPQSVQEIMKSWKEQNPSYEYRLFSRKSAYHFIHFQLGRDAAQAFLQCEHPAMQADFFRLAYLSKLGGFYADADDRCDKPLDSLVHSGAELVLKLGDLGCISNNFIGSAPNNAIIEDAFKKGITNMTTYFNEGPWFRLGPGHLTKSVTSQLAKFVEEKDFKKWPRIYTLDQVESRTYLYQHLALSYNSSDKSWFNAEYKKTISKTKTA